MDSTGLNLLAELAPRASTIVEVTKGVLTWEWDPRFGAALAGFDLSDVEKVRPVVEEVFGAAWSSANLPTAGDAVKAVAKAKGGLRPGQLLYTTDADSPATLLCAWWVWGSGARISVRIGYVISSDGEPAADAAAVESEFRSWFQI